MLDRDEDMMITGGRHPFMGKYKVGFNKDGRIVAFEAEIFNNAGYSTDLSTAVSLIKFNFVLMKVRRIMDIFTDSS